MKISLPDSRRVFSLPTLPEVLCRRGLFVVPLPPDEGLLRMTFSLPDG
jgi:hypothetical protein